MVVVVNDLKKSLKLWHAVGLTAVVLAVMLTLWLYPDTNGGSSPVPLKFIGGSLEPDDNVSWGQTVRIRRQVRWFVNCETVVNAREIIDSERVVHKLDPDYIRAPKLADLPPDRIVNSDKPMAVPSYLPPGKIGYRVTTCATCRELSKEPICIAAPVLEATVKGQ